MRLLISILIGRNYIYKDEKNGIFYSVNQELYLTLEYFNNKLVNTSN